MATGRGISDSQLICWARRGAWAAGLLLAALLLAACAPGTIPPAGGVDAAPAVDATATAARAVLDAALNAPAATPDAARTATAQADEMASAVAATLTAQPTLPPTPTETPRPVPFTATPDATATAAALAAQVAQSVNATLTAEARNRPADTPTRAATKSPTPTPTLLPPSATPAPPTSTPTRALAYHFLSLAAVANNSTHEGYVSPPQGEVTLGGVPFSLPPGTNSVTTQADSLPDNPATVTLDGLGIANPQAVYLLITGGNTRAEFTGVPVGEVRLIFAGGEAASVALVPGTNLREWKSYGTHNVTAIAAPEMREVWSGANKFDSGVATIDMLTFAIPPDLQGKTLAAVEVADRSQEWAGSANPAINLIGVTVLAQ